MKKSKIISFLQVYGILLVVIGHSSKNDNLSYLMTWIYNFHMPLFVFISGYLFLYTQIDKLNSGISCKYVIAFWRKRIKRFLFPYVLISSIAFFPKVYLGSFAIRAPQLTWGAWINQLVYPWDNVIIFFRFLPTIFLINSIVISVFTISSKCKLKHTLLLLSVFSTIIIYYIPSSKDSVFNIYGVLHYLFYFVFGMLYYRYQKVLDTKMKLNSSLCAIILIGFTFFLVKIEVSDIIKAIVGILASISLGYVYLKYNLKFFDHLNGSTYAIYLFSWFPQVFLIYVLTKFIEIHWFVIFLLAALSGIYVPYCIYKLILYAKVSCKYGKILSLLVGE